MTKYQLMEMLFNHTKNPHYINYGHGQCAVGWVQSIEREDGSGNCFNVTIRPAADNVPNYTVFVRTID